GPPVASGKLGGCNSLTLVPEILTGNADSLAACGVGLGAFLGCKGVFHHSAVKHLPQPVTAPMPGEAGEPPPSSLDNFPTSRFVSSDASWDTQGYATLAADVMYGVAHVPFRTGPHQTDTRPPKCWPSDRRAIRIDGPSAPNPAETLSCDSPDPSPCWPSAC